MTLLSLLACTAAIQINAPADANVYITKYPVSDDKPPAYYEAKGTGDTMAVVNYWAWERYYAWAGGPGYQAEVIAIPNEVKIGPLIAGVFFVWPALVWVSGPIERPIDLDPEKVANPRRAEDGQQR